MHHKSIRPIHRFLFWHYHISPTFVLNPGPEPNASMTLSVAADLYRLIKDLQAEAFDSTRGVDYARVRTSPRYAEYGLCSRRLQSFDPATLTTREEKLAFWINLYNALVIDAIIHLGVKESVNAVKGFFMRAAYEIGGWRYSADDIEHGILRANAAHPALPGAQFAANDSRNAFALEQLDPRIHFTLVCGARSCPPICVYTSEQIDAQLDLAARAFINDGGARMDQATRTVWLSQIFQWYAPDFGALPFALGRTKPLREFVSRYPAKESDREFILSSHSRIRLMPYDWHLNVCF